jgi:hypothetical protein
VPIGRHCLSRSGYPVRSRSRRRGVMGAPTNLDAALRRLMAIELASRPPPSEADRLEAERLAVQIANLRTMAAAAVNVDSDNPAPAG